MIIKPRDLIWDKFNKQHIKKHGTTKREVEEVCTKITTKLPAKKKRFMVIGKTKAGRTLTIILARKSSNQLYPVTARDTSRKERRSL